MRLGIISDTHDRLPTFERAVDLFLAERVEAILHAGDYVAPFAAKLLTPEKIGRTPLYAIYGNNDGERAGLARVLPGLVDGPLRVTLGGRTVVMHHFVDWLKPGEADGADVLVSGHNHEVSTSTRGGTLYLNPGECCGWLTGRATVALLETEDLSVQIRDIDTAWP